MHNCAKNGTAVALTDYGVIKCNSPEACQFKAAHPSFKFICERLLVEQAHRVRRMQAQAAQYQRR